ncbi:cupin domain-containing protein [Streptomyces sp. L7]
MQTEDGPGRRLTPSFSTTRVPDREESPRRPSARRPQPTGAVAPISPPPRTRTCTSQVPSRRRRLRGGMRRFAAVSGKTVGSEKLWMGQTHVAPATASSDHHHGESETAIYVVSGHPEFVFLDDAGPQPEEIRLRTSPGDYVFVPPFVPHRERTPTPRREAVVVIARSTQEAIVVNLPGLYVLGSGS